MSGLHFKYTLESVKRKQCDLLFRLGRGKKMPHHRKKSEKGKRRGRDLFLSSRPQVIHKPSHDLKQHLAVYSKRVAGSVTELIQAAEAMKGIVTCDLSNSPAAGRTRAAPAQSLLFTLSLSASITVGC